MMRCWAAAGLLVVTAASALHAQTPEGTAFTYQGRLTDGGSPASGAYDLRFTLFDAATAGSPVGSAITNEDVAVNTGLFTVALDFGSAAFDGSARWLGVEARPGASTGAFVVVGPRQRLTPAPTSIHSASVPWTGITGKPAGFADDVDDDSGGDITAVIAGSGLTGGAASGDATLAVDFGGSGTAVQASRTDHDHLGQSWSGSPATGLTIVTSGATALEGRTSNATNSAHGLFGLANALSGNTSGVHGRSLSSVGRGVLGEATSSAGSALGVLGITSSTAGAGVEGLTLGTAGSANGVTGLSSSTGGAGVFGQGATGVIARSVTAGGEALFAEAPAASGLTFGVHAEVNSPSGIAVYGLANATTGQARGVTGITSAPDGRGVVGTSGGPTPNGVGVFGIVFSTVGYAGYFEGNVHVAGVLSGPDPELEIDHPLDPENRVLRHAAVGSNERKNVYDGVVTTDASGYATVELPDWFEALNRDFRYQLTVVDEADSPDFVQAKVVKALAGSRFTLRSSAPHARVCWQVTGVRQDRFAQSRPLGVEQDKPERERGSYLQPEAWGLSPGTSRAARRWPDDRREPPAAATSQR